jgi:LmbE family N-acetylglucosaminyl deacetylase
MRSSPFKTSSEETMKKILVVAAHPDDEVLGCGGTIAKEAARGNEIHVLILARGLESRGPENQSAFDELKRHAQEANKILGVTKVHFGDLPDNKMDSVPLLDVVKLVEAHVKQIGPEVIYTHYENDLNIDHSLAAKAVITASRPLPGHSVKEVYFFETLSSTEWNFGQLGVFTPQLFEDVSPYLDKKLRAMSTYVSELRDWPHPRSIKGIEALAQLRGSTIGVPAAEAFSIVRITR